MRGLGDLIKWLASLLGFKPVEGCGCQQRQEALNRLVSFSWGDRDEG